MTIKNLLFFCLAFVTVTVSAQQTISAQDILQDIKSGKDISYQNATITGVLDLTYMKDKGGELPKKKNGIRVIIL